MDYGTCDVPWCDAPAVYKAKQLCLRHYSQIRKHGQVVDRACANCGARLAPGIRSWCSERCRYRGRKGPGPGENDRDCLYCGMSLAGRHYKAVICRSTDCLNKWRADYRVRTRQHKAGIDKAYRAQNRDRLVAASIARYAANGDEIREKRRSDEGRAYGRMAVQARRARKMQNGCFPISRRDVARLLERYRHRCAYCGTTGKLQLDHVIPIARGGRHSIGNLVPACSRCNGSKHAQFVMEWVHKNGRQRQVA